jgi:excisionase family DNA binding protein
MQFLGPKDIAAVIGIHEKTAVRMFRSGELPGFKAGPKLWRISRQSFEAWAKTKELSCRMATAPALPLSVLVLDRNRASVAIIKVNRSARV